MKPQWQLHDLTHPVAIFYEQSRAEEKEQESRSRSRKEAGVGEKVHENREKGSETKEQTQE